MSPLVSRRFLTGYCPVRALRRFLGDRRNARTGVWLLRNHVEVEWCLVPVEDPDLKIVPAFADDVNAPWLWRQDFAANGDALFDHAGCVVADLFLDVFEFGAHGYPENFVLMSWTVAPRPAPRALSSVACSFARRAISLRIAARCSHDMKNGLYASPLLPWMKDLGE